MSSHCRDMDELVKTEIMCWVGPSMCRANLSLLISLIKFSGSFSRAILFHEWKTLFSHARQVHQRASSLPWSCQRETHNFKFVMVDSHVSVASSRQNWPPRSFAALHSVTSGQPWIWKKWIAICTDDLCILFFVVVEFVSLPLSSSFAVELSRFIKIE